MPSFELLVPKNFKNHLNFCRITLKNLCLLFFYFVLGTSIILCGFTTYYKKDVFSFIVVKYDCIFT